MDLLTTLLIIAGAFDLALSSLLLVHGPRTRTTASYALLAAVLALWAAAILVLRLAVSPDVQFFALATSYVAGVAIAVSFWYFAMFFTGRPIRWHAHAAVLAGGFGVAVLAFTSPAFIEGIARAPTGDLVLRVGPAHLAFAGYLVIVLSAAFLQLLRRYRIAPAPERTQLASVFLGTFLTAVIGTMTNVVLVQTGNAEYIVWGPIATILMVAFIGFAIIRQNLMSVRLISAELFTMLLLIALLLEAMPAPGRLFRPIDGIALAFALGVSALLLRTVVREAAAREALAVANERLRDLDAAKSEFLSLTSHQVRTPLTAIRGYASMLVDGSFGVLEPSARDAVAKIRNLAIQLVRLVGDLLDLSRIESGRIRYDFKPVQLEDVVRTVIDELAETAKRKNIALRFENENGARLPIEADAEKLHEMVMNLVDNAITYSQAGSVEIRLRPALRAETGVLVLSITDHGIGISPEDLPKLFVKFGRTERAKQLQPGGMGLGLFLVKRLVEDHHGRVWAESPGLGKGSTFFVELPAIDNPLDQ